MLDAGAGTGQHVRISIDEWGLGPPWVVEDFNTAHALFGASFLTMSVNAAEAYGLAFTNLFEPVNEGALQVLQFDVSATPLGAAMPLFAALAGATRLAVEQPTPGGDDDVAAVAAVATGPAADALITLILSNRNATSGFTQWVLFDGETVAPTATVTLLAATGGFSSGSVFASSTFTISVSDEGWAAVPLPAFSIASIAVACLSC